MARGNDGKARVTKHPAITADDSWGMPVCPRCGARAVFNVTKPRTWEYKGRTLRDNGEVRAACPDCQYQTAWFEYEYGEPTVVDFANAADNWKRMVSGYEKRKAYLADLKARKESGNYIRRKAWEQCTDCGGKVSVSFKYCPWCGKEITL